MNFQIETWFSDFVVFEIVIFYMHSFSKCSILLKHYVLFDQHLCICYVVHFTQIYDRSQYNKKGIHKALQGNSKSLQLYPNNPRMVPQGLDPRPHKMHITVDKFVTNQKKDRKSKGGGRKSVAASTGIMNYVKPSECQS